MKHIITLSIMLFFVLIALTACPPSYIPPPQTPVSCDISAYHAVAIEANELTLCGLKSYNEISEINFYDRNSDIINDIHFRKMYMAGNRYIIANIYIGSDFFLSNWYVIDISTGKITRFEDEMFPNEESQLNGFSNTPYFQTDEDDNIYYIHSSAVYKIETEWLPDEFVVSNMTNKYNLDVDTFFVTQGNDIIFIANSRFYVANSIYHLEELNGENSYNPCCIWTTDEWHVFGSLYKDYNGNNYIRDMTTIKSIGLEHNKESSVSSTYPIYMKNSLFISTKDNKFIATGNHLSWLNDSAVSFHDYSFSFNKACFNQNFNFFYALEVGVNTYIYKIDNNLSNSLITTMEDFYGACMLDTGYLLYSDGEKLYIINPDGDIYKSFDGQYINLINIR